MIVTKFGGSSVASSEQFKKVKNIVEHDKNRKVVVSSACGKRNKDDYKMTDLLYLIYSHLQYSVNCDHLINIIETRFLEIESSLGIDADIKSDLAVFKKSLKKNMSLDYLVSRGEFLTSKLLAKYLGFKFVDAKDVIKLNYDGSINFEDTNILLGAYFSEAKSIVVPGFYGSTSDNKIKIMKRGGSDITGSIIARCAGADIYENWTDVSGILMADPRIVEEAKHIDVITYDELRELSYMGANVIHEDAVYPLKDVNIPINIRNTNDIDAKGTMIVSHTEDFTDNIITGIAGKKDYSTIAIYKHNASGEIGLMKKALEIFEKFEISVEHVLTGIDNFSIVVQTKDIKDRMYELVYQIKRACDTKEVKVSENIALLAIVGRNMVKHIGVSGRLFKTLGDNGINIRIICQGSDEINIIVGVENEDFKEAVKALYKEFGPQK